MKVSVMVTVHGTLSDFTFRTTVDPNDLDEYWAQGIEICEIINIVPGFIQWLGLTKVWFWLQNKRIIPL